MDGVKEKRRVFVVFSLSLSPFDCFDADADDEAKNSTDTHAEPLVFAPPSPSPSLKLSSKLENNRPRRSRQPSTPATRTT